MPRTKPTTLCLRAVDFRALPDEERTDEQQDGRTLTGYAAVFNTVTEINSWEGKFNETIARGAFRKTLQERTPVLQFDHGHDARTGSVPIGRFTELKEDKNGLRVEARLFDNPVVEPIRQAIEGEAISGMSFRFKVIRDEWTDKDGKKIKPDELLDMLWDGAGDRGPLNRTIREVQLFEAGPVVFPAYPETTVGVRSISDDDRRAIVEEYVRTAQDLPSTPDAAQDEGTSEEREEQDPVTPSSVDTSTGHEEVEVPAEIPAVPVARKLPELPVTVPEQRKDSVPMRTLAEMRARLAEIRSRMEEIDTENRDAVLTDEVQTEWDSLDREFAEVTASIERVVKRQESLRSTAQAPANVEHGSTTGPKIPTQRTSSTRENRDEMFDLDAIRMDSNSPEHFVELLRDNAMKAVERARFGNVTKREAAQEQVFALLDNADTEDGALAKRLLITGSPLYERAFGKALKALSTAPLSTDEQRALSMGADASGGYAVPFQLDPSVILTNNGAINPIRQMARVEQIVGKEWQGITSAGITVSRDGESVEVSDDSPTLAQPVVRPTRVAGFVPFSIEVDQDWGALRSEMTRMLQDAREREEATSFILGNGTAPNPSGVVSTLTGNTVAPGTAATFAYGDVYKMEEALAPRWRQNGQWLASKTVYNKVRQFDQQGGAQLWERIGAGMPGELLGYTARESSAMSSTIATTEKVLLFGDFQHFLIVDRVGMSIELVPHLFGGSGVTHYPTGQRGIYAIWRNNSKILVDAAFKLLVL